MPSESFLLPSDMRIFGQTLFGNREPISERDFSDEELANIRAAIVANQQRTGAASRGNVGYADYPKEEEIGPGHAPIQNTLGRFNYRVLPDGRTVVTDRYDFLNDERAPSVLAYERMSPTRRAVMAPLNMIIKMLQLRPVDAMGELGNAFIGREGRDVKINLPPVKKATGGLAQYKECSCGR